MRERVLESMILREIEGKRRWNWVDGVRRLFKVVDMVGIKVNTVG